MSFEPLEDRRLLSIVPTLPANWQAHPAFERLGTVSPSASGSSSPTGLNPNQVDTAYGLLSDSSGVFSNAINFYDSQTQKTVPGNGSGETIAIVDAYDDPNALSDLNNFSSYYGLPQFNVTGGPTFTKLNQSGGTSLPSAVGLDGLVH